MALTLTSEQTWRLDLYKVSQIENVTPNLSLGRGGTTASSWRRAQWFNLAVLFFTATFTVSNLVSDSGLLPLAAFYLLTASTLISFWGLSAAPFINPIQSFVLVQYVWFGVAPAVLSGYALLRGQVVELAVLQDDVILISIVVAPGLVLLGCISANHSAAQIVDISACAKIVSPSERLRTQIFTITVPSSWNRSFLSIPVRDNWDSGC